MIQRTRLNSERASRRDRTRRSNPSHSARFSNAHPKSVTISSAIATSTNIRTQAHYSGDGQLCQKRAGVSERQLFTLKPSVMQQARETLAGGFKVIKETSQSSLAATLHQHQCAHEICDNFLLMPVCVWQNKTDILDK